MVYFVHCVGIYIGAFFTYLAIIEIGFTFHSIIGGSDWFWFSLLFENTTVEEFCLNKLYVDPALNYFTNNYQNWAFSIFMTTALFSNNYVIILCSKPQLLYSSYKS